MHEPVLQARTRECERAWMYSCLSPLQTSGFQNGVQGTSCGSWKASKRVLWKMNLKSLLDWENIRMAALFKCSHTVIFLLTGTRSMWVCYFKEAPDSELNTLWRQTWNLIITKYILLLSTSLDYTFFLHGETGIKFIRDLSASSAGFFPSSLLSLHRLPLQTHMLDKLHIHYTRGFLYNLAGLIMSRESVHECERHLVKGAMAVSWIVKLLQSWRFWLKHLFSKIWITFHNRIFWGVLSFL